MFPSDEFYLIAKRELPPYEFYEDFPQIENGVGMLRDLEENFPGRLKTSGARHKAPRDDPDGRRRMRLWNM